MIDALTWQSCQWKWQIHFAGSIRWLPTKTQKSQTVSPPYHHPPSAIWLDITLTSSTSPQGPCTSLSLAKSRQTWQPVTYLCVVFKGSYWVLLCPEYSVFLGDRGASPAFFKNEFFFLSKILYMEFNKISSTNKVCCRYCICGYTENISFFLDIQSKRCF